MTFREIPLKKIYKGRLSFFQEALRPCFLGGAVEYDVLSAYFSSNSLISLSEGLDYFLSNQCNMRLVISTENPDRDLLQATETHVPEEQFELFQKKLLEDCKLLTDELEKSKVAVLAFLMKKGLLKIKLAVYKDGRFHPKEYILKDREGNIVVGSGSGNHTGAGFERNWEKHRVATSWGFGSDYFYDDDEDFESDVEIFEKIWSGEEQDLEVRELDKDFATELLNNLGNPSETAVLETIAKEKEDSINEFYKMLINSPIFQEFSVPVSSLYPHQINAVSLSQQSWPIRVLFADEVGLGKTLELGYLISYMVKFGLIDRVLIICPAQLTGQWQKEMNVHFELDFAKYNRVKKQWEYLDEINDPIKQVGRIQYSKNIPKFAIVSRGMAANNVEENIFENAEIYPDLLVVDEAHHARQLREYDGKLRNTIFRRILMKNREHLKHMAFATATPLRTNLDEPYFLLELLGIDKFLSESEYENSLELLERYWNRKPLFLADRMNAYKIIKKISMHTDNDLFSENTEFQELINEIGMLSQDEILASGWLDEKEDLLLNFLTIWHPVRIFTARNIQENLKKFPETYQIPERNIEATPIQNIDIDLDLETFFELLEQYIDTHYYKVEMYLNSVSSGGERTRTAPRALRLSQMRERFSSSFWSARKSVENRISTLKNRLLEYENEELNTIALEELLNSNLEGESEIEEEISSFNDDLIDSCVDLNIDWKRIAELTRNEILALEHIYNYANKIIRDCPKDKNPDPKINYLINELRNSYENSPDESILIFSKYTDTLEKVIEEVKSEFFAREEETFNGYGIFTGKNKKVYERGYPREVKAERELITEGLKSNKINIVFCSPAAGEGLNLQAASKLINIDVPWVAADLEQRIGRIARLGQKKPTVNILNFWYPNHESAMYQRIIKRARLGSFAVGEYPPVVSEEMKSDIKFSDYEVTDKAIDKINKLKQSHEFIRLNRLWNLNTGKGSKGDTFRKGVLDVIENFGGETAGFEYQAGDENTINLNSNALKESLSKNNDLLAEGNCDLYALLNNKQIWGLIFSFDNKNEEYLINPYELPGLLKSLYQNIEINPEKIIFENVLTVKELLNSYKENGFNIMFPAHYLVKNSHPDEEFELPYEYSSELIKNHIGKIKCATEEN